MVVWVASGAWWEIYGRIETAHPRVILRDALRQCLIGVVSVVVFEYMLRLDLSRSFLGIFGGCAWFLLCLFRLNGGAIVGIVRREFGRPQHVVVVGTGDAAQRIGRQLEEAAQYGVRLTSFVADSPASCPAAIELEGKYPVYALSTLPDLLRSHVIDEIVF